MSKFICRITGTSDDVNRQMIFFFEKKKYTIKFHTVKEKRMMTREINKCIAQNRPEMMMIMMVNQTTSSPLATNIEIETEKQQKNLDMNEQSKKTC